MGEDNRQLGKIGNIVGHMGLDITYAWEDIVFIEHGVFLFQFTDLANDVLVHFSDECTAEEQEKVMAEITEAAKKEQMNVSYKGKFTLEQKDDEEMQLKFIS